MNRLFTVCALLFVCFGLTLAQRGLTLAQTGRPGQMGDGQPPPPPPTGRPGQLGDADEEGLLMEDHLTEGANTEEEKVELVRRQGPPRPPSPGDSPYPTPPLPPGDTLEDHLTEDDKIELGRREIPHSIPTQIPPGIPGDSQHSIPTQIPPGIPGDSQPSRPGPIGEEDHLKEGANTEEEKVELVRRQSPLPPGDTLEEDHLKEGANTEEEKVELVRRQAKPRPGDKIPPHGDNPFMDVDTLTEVPTTHEEWVELVREQAQRLHRLPRSSHYEPASDINDVKQHYRDAFDKVKNMATDQDKEETREMYVSGRYIVFMAEHTSDRQLNKVIRVLKTYSRKDKSGHFIADHFSTIRHVGKGFTATLSTPVVHVLRKHPSMYTVENDVVLQRSSHIDFDNLEQVLAQENDDIETQGQTDEADTTENNKASTQTVEWNLDRIDQRSLPLDRHTFHAKGNGRGVDVYVLDTGIRYTHQEFNGRARYSGYDAIDALVSSSSKRGNDCNGHGTHCAATIGGRTFGVARSANLFSTRVLDCSGTGSVSGIIHAMNHIIGTRKRLHKSKTAVLSMSLGVKRSIGFNNAINQAVSSGMVIVSASGNQMGDSCRYSPGSAALAISVGATDQRDTSTSFSNIGRCTHIHAPGYGIHSASSNCDTCTTTKSGTSMACPHVAGYAAIVLGRHPSFTPSQVKDQMIRDSSKNKIHFDGRESLANLTPNRLLYVGN